MIAMKHILIFLIICWGLWTGSCWAQYKNDNNRASAEWSITSNDTIKKSSAKSPTGAMIRSLIVPGWGQLYNKKIFKAILIFGAETGLIANSIYLNQKYRKWNQKYRNSEPGPEQDIIFANREFYINNRNLSNWWLLGVILFSMADAFVDAHLADFDESPDLSYLNILPMPAGNSIGIQVSVRMSF